MFTVRGQVAHGEWWRVVVEREMIAGGQREEVGQGYRCGKIRQNG